MYNIGFIQGLYRGYIPGYVSYRVLYTDYIGVIFQGRYNIGIIQAEFGDFMGGYIPGIYYVGITGELYRG